MLLKRLDVTVQSFGWSERAKVYFTQIVYKHCYCKDTFGCGCLTMYLKDIELSFWGFFFLSFLSQTRGEKLAKVYPPLRSALSTASKISVAHLLAARQDFSKILRTSSGKMREKTACAINKVNLTEHPFNGL